MENWFGIDVSNLYKKVMHAYERMIQEHTYTEQIIENYEKVYVIDDVFVVYLGIVNFSINAQCQHGDFRIVFEELLDNSVLNFNFSSFLRQFDTKERTLIIYKRFHGKIAEPIREIDKTRYDMFLEYRNYVDSFLQYTIDSKYEYVNAAFPNLKLRDRYNSWMGYLYNYIIFELIDKGKTGYAIYCSKNPHIHRVARQQANEVEWCALEYFSGLSRMNPAFIGTEKDHSRDDFLSDTLYNRVKCDWNMIDILIERINENKNNEIQKRKKGISFHILCLAEHDLKYFWISKYIKTENHLEVGKQIFSDVHKGKYKEAPRYEYLVPENKWKSEQLVFELTSKIFKKNTVIYQYSPFFLKTEKGQMSYDVFICGKNIAIEYQGKQQFEPIDIFGGEESYKKQIERDRLKQKLSKENGIVLVYINYWEDISEDLIKAKIAAALNPTL